MFTAFKFLTGVVVYVVSTNVTAAVYDGVANAFKSKEEKKS